MLTKTHTHTQTQPCSQEKENATKWKEKLKEKLSGDKLWQLEGAGVIWENSLRNLRHNNFSNKKRLLLVTLYFHDIQFSSQKKIMQAEIKHNEKNKQFLQCI